MRKFLLLLAVLAAGLTVGASAQANAPQWGIHTNGHGEYNCDRGHNWIVGPFQTRAECLVALGPSEGFIYECETDEGHANYIEEVRWPFMAARFDSDGDAQISPCPEPDGVSVTVNEPQSAFLAYSVGGDLYVTQTEAVDLFSGMFGSGYWLPTALPGWVDGGTNIGGVGSNAKYHLVAAAPILGETYGPFVDQGQVYVDHNGDVLDFDSASSTGFAGVYLVG